MHLRVVRPGRIGIRREPMASGSKDSLGMALHAIMEAAVHRHMGVAVVRRPMVVAVDMVAQALADEAEAMETRVGAGFLPGGARAPAIGHGVLRAPPLSKMRCMGSAPRVVTPPLMALTRLGMTTWTCP